LNLGNPNSASGNLIINKTVGPGSLNISNIVNGAEEVKKSSSGRRAADASPNNVGNKKTTVE
jgi:hypothetical protein